jgi:hypothetical protein
MRELRSRSGVSLPWRGSVLAVVTLLGLLPHGARADATACRIESPRFEAAPSAGDDLLHPQPLPSLRLTLQDGRTVNLPANPHAALHGQLLLGAQAPYLYHLPLFMPDPGRHPHNFQVILEVEFAQAQTKASFLDHRAAHRRDLYTMEPLPFDQNRLVLSYPGHLPLRSLKGGVFHGHFEREGSSRILANAELAITNIVHFREFDPAGARPDTLQYLLFGRQGEALMIHLLFAPPPDFDQVLEVGIDGSPIAEERLQQGLRVTLAERRNRVEDRLRAGEAIACIMSGEDGAATTQATIRIGHEPYCEAGELAELGGGSPMDCPAR